MRSCSPTFWLVLLLSSSLYVVLPACLLLPTMIAFIIYSARQPNCRPHPAQANPYLSGSIDFRDRLRRLSHFVKSMECADPEMAGKLAKRSVYPSRDLSYSRRFVLSSCRRSPCHWGQNLIEHVPALVQVSLSLAERLFQ